MFGIVDARLTIGWSRASNVVVFESNEGGRRSGEESPPGRLRAALVLAGLFAQERLDAFAAEARQKIVRHALRERVDRFARDFHRIAQHHALVESGEQIAQDIGAAAGQARIMR